MTRTSQASVSVSRHRANATRSFRPHAIWLFGGLFLLGGCDVRKLFGDSHLEPKTCESTKECVFQTSAGARQQICETDGNTCRGCQNAKECRDGYSEALVCDSQDGNCRKCQTLNQECHKADKYLPICDESSGVCKACASDGDCKKEGFITCNTPVCEGCKNSADCTQRDKPICNTATKACEPCKKDSECATGLCYDDGSSIGVSLARPDRKGECVSATEIAYVNGSNPLQAAVDGGRRFMEVSGGSYSYSGSISREVYVYPKTGTGAVTINGNFVTSQVAKLWMLDVTVQDATKTNKLIDCQGGEVRLYKVTLLYGLRGFEAGGSCTEVGLNRVKIKESAGSGLVLSGSVKYSVVNSSIYKTGTSNGTGVVLSTSQNGKFAFNTVRANGDSGGNVQGGLDCGTAGQKTVVNSIFYNNDLFPDTQFKNPANCTFNQVVVGPTDATTASGVIKSALIFKSEEELDPTDTACADQGVADPAVQEDFFGSVRPKGPKPDIGCHEVK